MSEKEFAYELHSILILCHESYERKKRKKNVINSTKL